MSHRGMSKVKPGHSRTCKSVLALGATIVAVVTASSVPALAAGGTTTGADLQISGSISPSSPAAGSTFSETFQIKNSGPDSATSVGFEDDVPLSFGYSSATVNDTSATCASAPDSAGNNVISCELGDLASSTKDTVGVTLVAPATAGSYGTQAKTFATSTDPSINNNAVVFIIKVGSGGTATTPPPPPPPPPSTGPCATIDPSSSSQTQLFATNSMGTKISNCGSTTLTNLVVVWDPGGPSLDYQAFRCAAPQSTNGGSYSLSPGASLTANCKHNTPGVPPGTVASGVGTVGVYDQCASFDSPANNNAAAGDRTLVPGGTFCSDEPQTLLAQAAFNWSINVPASAPPQGGNRGDA
jgi:hypothetical protein